MQIADIVIASPVTPDCEDDPKLWAECVVGATVDETYLNMFRDAGFEDIEVLRDYDYFAHSPSKDTQNIAKQFGAHALELRMRRGASAPSKIVQWAKRMDPRRIAGDVQRRGLWGTLAMIMAVVACYGTLLMVGLMSLLGVSIAVDEGAWAGAIIGFSAAVTVIVALGMRRHHSIVPLVIAVLGVLVLLYTMYVNYNLITEIIGFLLLAAATWLDFDLRRWSRVPGGKKAAAARDRSHGLKDDPTRPVQP